MLTRRRLLAAIAAPTLVPLPQERVAFKVPGVPGAIVLPAARSRLLRVLTLGDRDVAVLGFAADPPRAGRLDMAAIVGWDGQGPRILALEVWSWRDDAGARLTTRLSASGDRARLLLARDAAVPRGPTLWRRESWIDMLARAEGGTLADAPPRPPLPGTWQHRLAADRARLRAALGVQPCQQVSPALLALCTPPDLLPPDQPGGASPM